MSTGAIITVLANIPWGQVIDNAPKVADGAARLWNAVSGRKAAVPAPDEAQAGAPQLTETQALRQQVAALQATAQDLQEQMKASSELIKALAEQNALLVQRVEMNRLQLRRTVMVAGAAMLLLAAAIGYLLAGA